VDFDYRFIDEFHMSKIKKPCCQSRASRL
jgi:hypothetical protein